MSSTSHEIVHEGWLTKSPPSKRIWRAKWRRRWFTLRQSGELPGQYYLDYYSDRNRRKLKGRIDLDLCDQVDAGLYMERGSESALGSRVRGSVFSVRTSARTYHLEADCEADMQKWVDAICGVCGLRPDQPSPPPPDIPVAPIDHAPIVEPCPYIRISECITGVRSPDRDRPRAHTLDGRNEPRGGAGGSRVRGPDLANGPTDGSDNDSTRSAEERPSNNDGPVEGPPVPPRPPKSFRLVRDGSHTDRPYTSSNIDKFFTDREMPSSSNSQEVPSNASADTPPVAKTAPLKTNPAPRESKEPMDNGVQRYSRPSHHYSNLLSLPPAIDRDLKPRSCDDSNGFSKSQSGWSSHGRMDYYYVGVRKSQKKKMERSDTLQYLDLDFSSSKPSCSKDRPAASTSHTKSKSDDSDNGYKTVDFLKTEAFNFTRLDAEALRRNAMAH